MSSAQNTEQHDAPDNTELQAAKKATQTLVSAFKAYSLYPPEHAFSRKNVAKLQEDLETFLRDYPVLRMDIGRNAFTYKGQVLFDGPPEENNPAYLLTRDGVIYLEFTRDLDLAETSALLGVLNRNRNPFEEPEGDIVTALWQENFAHILYEEVDIFTLESFQFDLSTFRMAPEPGDLAKQPGLADQTVGPAPGEEAGQDQNSIQVQAAANIFLTEQGATLMAISHEEAESLTAQVLAEERKDYTSDIIDILLIILVVQKNKVNFLHALEFLEFQFFETLDKGDFHLSYKLLNNIQLLRGQFQQQKTWAPSLLDSFILSLSGEEKFAQVSWLKNTGALWRHTPYLAQLFQVLRLLAPEIIMTLGPLAAGIPMENLHVRNELLEIVESKARQEPERLRALLAKSGEQVNLLLAPAVASLIRVDAARIYLQMTRHSSAEIRKLGLDSYMQVAAQPDFNELAHLLGDDDSRLRERIISYLFQAGLDITESQLLRFLDQAKHSDLQDQRLVFEHYRALAACRPHLILPFLEKTLLESRLSEMFSNSNSVHIKGAALALRTIGTAEAMAILKRGGSSMRPDVRLSCQHVLKR